MVKCTPPPPPPSQSQSQSPSPSPSPSQASTSQRKARTGGNKRRRTGSSSQLNVSRSSQNLDVICEMPQASTESYSVNAAAGSMCYFRNEYTISWFGFSENLYRYFGAMAVIFIIFFLIVLDVQVFYQSKEPKKTKEELKIPRSLLALYVFLPHILLFLGPVIFAVSTRDFNLETFLVMRDLIEFHATDKAAFSNGFQTQVMSQRKYGFGMLAFNLILKLASYCIKPHNLPAIFYIADFCLWTYLVISYMLCIMFSSMAVHCFKLHVAVFKGSINSSNRTYGAILGHYNRLSESIERLSSRLSHFIFWLILICAFTVSVTLAILYHTYFKKHQNVVSKGAEHFVCLSLLLVPSFWHAIFAMEDLNSEFETIGDVLDKKVANEDHGRTVNDETAKRWRRLAKFMLRSHGGVYIFGRKVDKSLHDLTFSTHLSLALLMICLVVTATIDLLSNLADGKDITNL